MQYTSVRQKLTLRCSPKTLSDNHGSSNERNPCGRRGTVNCHTLKSIIIICPIVIIIIITKGFQ